MVRQLAWLMGSAAALGVASALASTVALTATQESSQDLKITDARIWDGGARAPWQLARLTVPDLDPTIGRSVQSLRQYDYHVARMFELTHAQCQKNDALQGMQWTYEIANGNVNRGQFRIRCQTAVEVVSGYRLTKSDVIPVTIEGRQRVTTDPTVIPTLDITGTKVENWTRFVQAIHPLRSRLYSPNAPTVALRKDQVRVQGSIGVELVLPRVLPKLAMVKDSDRFVAVPQDQGYRVCPTVGESQVCDRTRARAFQQFSAKASGDFYDAQKLPAGAIYRKIELAERTPGIYVENCGDRSCTSSVQWKQDGMLYEIQAQYREQPILVAIANSAIGSTQVK